MKSTNGGVMDIGIPWSDIGLTGFVSVTIMALIAGWLVPAKQANSNYAKYQLIIDDKNATILDIKHTNTILEKITDDQSTQIHALIARGSAANDALTTIARAAVGNATQ